MGMMKTSHILIIVIVVLCGLLYFSHKKYKKCSDQSVNANIEIASLRSGILTYANLIKAKDARIDKYEIFIQSLNDSITYYKGKIKQDEKEYNDELEKLKHIPVDSSYQFLITRAYPYQGEMNYRFNQYHVKSFHQAYITNNYYAIRIKDVEFAFETSEKKNGTLNLVIGEYKEKEVYYKNIISLSDSIYVICTSETNRLSDDLNKQTNRKKWWRRLGVIAGGYIAFQLLTN